MPTVTARSAATDSRAAAGVRPTSTGLPVRDVEQATAHVEQMVSELAIDGRFAGREHLVEGQPPAPGRGHLRQHPRELLLGHDTLSLVLPTRGRSERFPNSEW